MKRKSTDDEIYIYYQKHFPKESIEQIAFHFHERTRKIYDIVRRKTAENTAKTKKDLTADQEGTWITGTRHFDGYASKFSGMGLDMEIVEKVLLEAWHVFDNDKKEKQPLIKRKLF